MASALPSSRKSDPGPAGNQRASWPYRNSGTSRLSPDFPELTRARLSRKPRKPRLVRHTFELESVLTNPGSLVEGDGLQGRKRLLFLKPVMRLALCIWLLCCAPAFANKIPSSDWQTGTLKDVTQEERSATVGTMNNGHGSLQGSSYSIPHYIIETDSYIYEVVHSRGHSRKKARMPVTVNGPIKFAIVSSDFYVQDEQGQEHKMAIAFGIMRFSALHLATVLRTRLREQNTIFRSANRHPEGCNSRGTIRNGWYHEQRSRLVTGL